jgi:hypothetical protein
MGLGSNPTFLQPTADFYLKVRHYTVVLMVLGSNPTFPPAYSRLLSPGGVPPGMEWMAIGALWGVREEEKSRRRTKEPPGRD